MDTYFETTSFQVEEEERKIERALRLLEPSEATVSVYIE